MLLVAVFVAALIGLSVMGVLYSVIAIGLASIADYANRMRKTVRQVMNNRLGYVEQVSAENEDLRSELDRTLTESRQREERHIQIMSRQESRISQPQVNVERSKNYITYNHSAADQQIINNALLIHQQYILGKNSKNPVNLWSRERMEADKHLSQAEWGEARAWLVGAGVLEYKNRVVAIWKEDDSRVVRAMLNDYCYNRRHRYAQ